MLVEMMVEKKAARKAKMTVVKWVVLAVRKVDMKA